MIDITNQNPSVMKHVTSSTQAAKNGTTVLCPNCFNPITVFKFDHILIPCAECGSWLKETSLWIDEEIPEAARNIRNAIIAYLNSEEFKMQINRTPATSIIHKIEMNLMASPDLLFVKDVQCAINDLLSQQYSLEDARDLFIVACALELYEQEELNGKGN